MSAGASLMRRASLEDKVAVGFVAVLLLLFSLGSEEVARGTETKEVDAAAIALLVAACTALVWRHRAPATVAVVVLVLSLAWYGSGYTSGLINVPTMVAFYSVGLTGDRRRQLGVGAMAVTVLLIGTMIVAGESWTEVVDAIGWTVTAILFGELVNSRRQLLAELAARAERAEAERDAEAERRVVDERLRIARDVHDALAHTVSVMTVQAGVAAETVERDPGAAKAALGAIRAAGREATGEVRALVAVLRNGVGPVGIDPAPRLERLDDLVAAMGAAGPHVELTVDTGPAPLPAIVELTAYRLVQESLTNVIRHSSASTAQVAVRREGDELRIETVDDGTGSAQGGATAGFGLRGMGERVESLGGTLAYGPRPNGGWRVSATIPLKSAAAP